MRAALRRIGRDIRQLRNIDAYVVSALALVFAVLTVVGDLVSEQVRWAAVLAGPGLHVSRDPFDAALRLPSIVARQIGAAALAPTCRRCPVHRVCGGGLYAHRHRVGSGFANPSVYCRDLSALIRHIRDRIMADLAAPPGGGPR